MTDAERRKDKVRRKITEIIPVLVLYARHKRDIKQVVHDLNKAGKKHWSYSMVYRRLTIIVKGLMK